MVAICPSKRISMKNERCERGDDGERVGKLPYLTDNTFRKICQDVTHLLNIESNGNDFRLVGIVNMSIVHNK
jgi:hypothetical protein